MEKVYIVFWTFTFDVEDYECQPKTSMVGVFSTEELAKQKVDYLANSIGKEEILSYDDYMKEFYSANGIMDPDPELGYGNYLYTMRDTSSSYYHYEEWPILEKLGE